MTHTGIMHVVYVHISGDRHACPELHTCKACRVSTHVHICIASRVRDSVPACDRGLQAASIVAAQRHCPPHATYSSILSRVRDSLPLPAAAGSTHRQRGSEHSAPRRREAVQNNVLAVFLSQLSVEPHIKPQQSHVSSHEICLRLHCFFRLHVCI